MSPANRPKLTVVVVGTGLAGAGAAAALGELGYRVHAVTYHDSPRRAHSVAAQGGVNAVLDVGVDGDGLERFVTDTVKGGDFRGREAEAYRLGFESAGVIDHMNAIGVPFAREYGGPLSRRSFGGVQVSRTYYARGQTGQQMQIAASQALWRQVDRGTVQVHPRTEMLDLVIEGGRARGVIVRDLRDGRISVLPAHAVVLATGGYGSVYYHSTLALSSNASAAWRAHRRGALFASPSFLQFHPTALPVDSPWTAKTILMSESLRNDGRVWVPMKPGDERQPNDIPEQERDYYLERKYPRFGNLCPRDVASRAATEEIRAGRGVGPLRNSVYLDFADARKAHGKRVLAQRYGNLFDMYKSATGEDPYRVPMRIAPSAHFSMGGLWTDFNLMSNVPGLFVGGEASWGYHGANRLGANSLLSACVDGWFALPLSVPNYLADQVGMPLPDPDSACVQGPMRAVQNRVDTLLGVKGRTPPAQFHRRLGEILYEAAGVQRSKSGLEKGLRDVRDLRMEFWRDVSVPGGPHLNSTLEKAGRVADFLELAELMLTDALDREESCGAHFRVEFQEEGEAARDDSRWAFVSAWETSPGAQLKFTRHAEPLEFRSVPLATRSYQ